jgi:hypothetical protein
MRFLIMVQFAPNIEANLKPPTQEDLEKMDAFNEGLVRDGHMLDAGGLQPSGKGVRITYNSGKPVVTDGPFTESKEVVAGFSIMQGLSKEEIIERLKQWPVNPDQPFQVEIRQLFEPEDFKA